jgi:hypothetical protein
MIRIRRYWNEPSKPINIPGPVRYTNAVTGVDKEITPMWALMNDRTDVVQFSKNEYKYALAAVNAKYFSNRLVLLGAVRRDSFKNKVTSQSEWGDYSATTWDGVTPRYKPDAPADYATLTYVPRDANGVATGPAVSADNSYNNLRNTRANFVSQRRISQDQPSVNFYNDYTVGSGQLKGLRFGAGVQYRGKQIVGYRAADTIVNPADPTRAIDNPNVDAYTAVFTPNSYHTVVATLGYTLRLKNRRQLDFGLKVDNLLKFPRPALRRRQFRPASVGRELLVPSP